jgi:acyl-CoA dehydrogenase
MSACDMQALSEDDFRRTVQDFLEQSFTPELRAQADRQAGVFAQPQLAAAWHQILYRKGWIAPSWPLQYGGTGWTRRQQMIYEEECARVNSPVLPAMGLQMCGPVLIGQGTAQQKAHFLPKILSGEHFWCQGYSEPESGSDLASLKCRAVRDNDDYVISGSKIWTTYAHVANWMFVLVRTDSSVKPQAGITFLLVPMNSHGIEVTPIRSMSGEHEVNEVFFDAVRVPVENRVGAENDGWRVAKYLLEFERGGGTAIGRALRVVGLIRRLARGHGSLEPEIVDRLIDLEIEIAATEWTQRRMLAAVETGASVGPANASILKLKAAELYQLASMLLYDALGIWGLLDTRGASSRVLDSDIAATAAARYMNSRAMSIFGGSSEIQRTILAKEALHL